jgi:hypothetical protein
MSSPGRQRRTSVQPPARPTIVVVTPAGLELSRWPLPGADEPDLELADRVARCQLAARRLGCAIELRDADARLAGLLELLGWQGIVVVTTLASGGPPSEVVGQAEEREQGGIEEVVVTDDPII